MAQTRVSDIVRLTQAGVDLVFNRAAKMPRRKYYTQIVHEKQQRKQIGNYVTIGNLGPAGEIPEGDIPMFDKIQQNYETNITSRKVGKGVEATIESKEFDLENVVNQTFGTPLMRVMQTLKEREVADLYNDSFTTTGADGVAIHAATHPLQSSALVNNNLMTGALTPENLITAKNMFNFIYDQAGDFFDTEPTHLLIHPNKSFLAAEILQSQLVAHELSNTKNVSQEFMPIRPIVNKYLDYNSTTGASPWFLLDMTYDDAGAILQTKRGLNLKTWWVNESSVFRGLASEWYGTGWISPGYASVGSAG